MNEDLPEDTEYPAGFLTLPHPRRTLGYAREASGARAIAYVPLVKSDQEDVWQHYTERHVSWIQEAQENANTTNIMAAIPDFIWEVEDYEWEKGREKKLPSLPDFPRKVKGEDFQDKIVASNPNVQEENKDFFAPVWQMVPVPGRAPLGYTGELSPFDGIINYNLADRITFQSAAEMIVKTKMPV